GLDGGLLGGAALLDVGGGIFDDDDGVIDDDADGEDEGKQRHEVDGKAQEGHGGEGAEDGDGHGGSGDEHGAEVLQKEHDHQQHQHPRLNQSLIHPVDRISYESGGVEQHHVPEPVRELLAHLRHQLLHFL